jgi:hypothetical protein
MIVGVSDTRLLVLAPDSDQPRVLRAISVVNDVYIYPLWWLIIKRLDGAQLIDQQGKRSRVIKAKFVGIASQINLGAPFFEYLLLVTVGSLTLSTPIKVKFLLELIDQMDFSTTKDHVLSVLKKNPNAYPNTSIEVMLRSVQRSSSIEAIANAIGRD